MRKWRKENAEHVNEYNREYARNYYRLNKHKHNYYEEYVKPYYEKNKELIK